MPCFFHSAHARSNTHATTESPHIPQSVKAAASSRQSGVSSGAGQEAHTDSGPRRSAGFTLNPRLVAGESARVCRGLHCEEGAGEEEDEEEEEALLGTGR